jgi:hypothetical protein
VPSGYYRLSKAKKHFLGVVGVCACNRYQAPFPLLPGPGYKATILSVAILKLEKLERQY